MLICSIPGRQRLKLSWSLTLRPESAGGTRHAVPFRVMFTILCILAAVWVVCSGLFVAALAAASKRALPMPQPDVTVLEEAA